MNHVGLQAPGSSQQSLAHPSTVDARRPGDEPAAPTDAPRRTREFQPLLAKPGLLQGLDVDEIVVRLVALSPQSCNLELGFTEELAVYALLLDRVRVSIQPGCRAVDAVHERAIHVIDDQEPHWIDSPPPRPPQARDGFSRQPATPDRVHVGPR